MVIKHNVATMFIVCEIKCISAITIGFLNKVFYNEFLYANFKDSSKQDNEFPYSK